MTRRLGGINGVRNDLSALATATYVRIQARRPQSTGQVHECYGNITLFYIIRIVTSIPQLVSHSYLGNCAGFKFSISIVFVETITFLFSFFVCFFLHFHAFFTFFDVFGLV
jgi:hypothetical protein